MLFNLLHLNFSVHLQYYTYFVWVAPLSYNP